MLRCKRVHLPQAADSRQPTSKSGYEMLTGPAADIEVKYLFHTTGIEVARQINGFSDCARVKRDYITPRLVTGRCAFSVFTIPRPASAISSGLTISLLR